MSNWDLERTGDKCQIKKYDTNACDGCRCYEYCHRTKTLFEIAKERGKE